MEPKSLTLNSKAPHPQTHPIISDCEPHLPDCILIYENLGLWGGVPYIYIYTCIYIYMCVCIDIDLHTYKRVFLYNPYVDVAFLALAVG